MGSDGVIHAPTRVASLDYLRGLMALAVMVFHFEKWTTGFWDAGSLSGKLGVYAVSVFFVISGMAMTMSYQGRLFQQPGAIRMYAWNRARRIFPLLWVVTIATLLLEAAPRSPWVVFLNFSGLFGLVDASLDIATGAWSIGCELVYYCLFPGLLWCGLFKPRWFWGILMALAVAGLARAFFSPFEAGVAQQIWWPVYVQAWLHAWFFAAGVALALYYPVLKIAPRLFWRGMLLTVLLWFAAESIPVEPVFLLKDGWRLSLALCAVLITASWSLGVGTLEKAPGKVLSWLGQVSYGLYLLHPLVYRVVKAIFVRLQAGTTWQMLLVAALLTLLASHLSFNWLERPAMRWKWRALER